MKKEIFKIFEKKEIFSIDKFYLFDDRKKIIVFVPASHLQNLLKEMSKAGAGNIGNYTMCSFRTEGTGTFKPGSKAKPFSGSKFSLSNESEFKLEMECCTGNLNKVINVLLKNHPYEEAVYEIYNFKKRRKPDSGYVIEMKKETDLNQLGKKLNKEILSDAEKRNLKFRKIAFVKKNIDNLILSSAGYTGCDYVLNKFNNKYKLYKI